MLFYEKMLVHDSTFERYHKNIIDMNGKNVKKGLKISGISFSVMFVKCITCLTDGLYFLYKRIPLDVPVLRLL